MNIAILLMIPASMAIAGFLVLKGVQLGLKWQIQVNNKQELEPVIQNPVEPIIQEKKEQKYFANMNQVITEYLHGEQEGR